MGRNIPAGYYRKGYAFQKWHHFDNKLWNQIVREAGEKILHKRIQIVGYDNIWANIDLSKKNSRRILIHNYVKFKKAELCDFQPDVPGVIIMNPPYGVRLGEDKELESLYGLIGDVLKSSCQDSHAYIITGNLELAKHIGLKSDSKIILKNGKIDCRLLHFPIRHGKYSS